MINVMYEYGLTWMYYHAPQEAGRATLGHVDGANPASGAYRYYTHDRKCRTGVQRTRGRGAECRRMPSTAGAMERGEPRNSEYTEHTERREGGKGGWMPYACS
jgi:hypothetical protein